MTSNQRLKSRVQRAELEDFLVYWFYHVSVMLVYLNSCINPFIYAAKYGEFQNGIKRMIARLTRASPPPIQPQQQQQNIGISGTQDTPMYPQPQDTAVT